MATYTNWQVVTMGGKYRIQNMVDGEWLHHVTRTYDAQGHMAPIQEFVTLLDAQTALALIPVWVTVP